jgi:hypothetical protein
MEAGEAISVAYKYIINDVDTGVVEIETYSTDLKLSKGNYVKMNIGVWGKKYFMIKEIEKVLEYDTNTVIFVLYVQDMGPDMFSDISGV